MRINRSISFFLCLFSWIGYLRAQISPVPLPAKSSTTANAPTTQPPAYQLAVRVRRVVLDVVVTDTKGKLVEGLKQDDFTVMEDRVIQPLRFFDMHNGAAARGSQQTLDLHLPANTFSNLSLAPRISR